MGARTPLVAVRGSGMSAEELADADSRVSVDRLRRVWAELPALLGADDFGLRVALVPREPAFARLRTRRGVARGLRLGEC